MRGLLWIAISAACLLPLHAFAQQPSKDECTDERGVDRCLPTEHRRMLDLYGMLPIERHATAGEEARRAFYIDGYGRDVVAIAFVRGPTREPTLTVHFPRVDGILPPPATAPVPEATWSDVIRRSTYFDRDLVPLPPPPPGTTITVCAHSWVYAVEAVERDRQGDRPLRVRRRTEDACGDGLAKAYASELPLVALPLLPHCNALDPSRHRNTATTLGECWRLAGDRLSAAHGYNLLARLRSISPMDRAGLASMFDWHAIVETDDGQSRAGPEAASDAWMRSVVAGNARLTIETVTGESAYRVSARGTLTRYDTDPGQSTRRSIAPVAFQMGSRLGEGDLVLERVTIGRFDPANAD